jgi:streptogramin lyase
MAVAGAVGVIFAVATPWTSPSDDALDGSWNSVEADKDYGANSRLEPDSVDSRVEFPGSISELPNPPSHLAVDPNSGDLWFVMFTYTGTTNDLYRYSPSKDEVEIRPIPSGTGSEFFSDIAVDDRGHVILAEGDSVLDIDPEGEYRRLTLPPSANFAKQPGWDGTYVIDMVLGGDGKAYLTRMNTAAITQIDIETGSTVEIPIPSSMGQFYYLALSGRSLWMTTWADTLDRPSQTAVVDLDTGEVAPTALKSVALVGDAQGRVFLAAQGSETGTPGLLIAEPAPGGLSASTDQVPTVMLAEDKSLSGLRDYLAVDMDRGTVWVAGGDGITVLQTSGRTDHYALPKFEKVPPFSIPSACIDLDCPSSSDALTSVGGIAVAPDGSLFFSDMSYNRIGVVHPR